MPTYRYVRVNGLDQMHRKLQAIPIEMKTQQLGAKALYPAVRAVKESVIATAPVYSGLLQENIISYRDRNPENLRVNAHYSIRVRRINLSKKVKRLLKRIRKIGVNVRVTQDPYYWRFVEYGTSRIPAQGFMHKGIARAEPQLVALVNAAMTKNLDAILKKIGST